MAKQMIQGVQLTPENLTFPVVGFLADEEKLKSYKERIKKYGEKARKTLDIFSFDNLIKGSNPFADVELASDILALPSELEHAVRINPDYFKDCYEDIGLVLRTNGDSYAPNDYIAKHLAEQVKKRTGKLLTLDKPVRISLKGLSLSEDNASDYGLVFVIGENTGVISVPEFAYENNRKRFSRTDERGVPIFNDNGNRIFYARQQGVSRLFLDRYLGLDSNDDYLAYSNDSGRVVVKTCEAGSQKTLDEYLAKLQAERDKQIAEIQGRYAQAMQVLKGEHQ